jgi:uncharacterized protein (TIGR03086 family)
MVNAATRAVLANVTADDMSKATPCASWDVAGLINHLVGAQYFFAAGMKGERPSGGETDYAAGDYVSAFDEAAATLAACFDADGVMETTVKMPFGEMPAGAVMGLAMNDTFTHGWDLAKATGQSTDIAPQLATQILEQAKSSIQDAFRGEDGAAPFGLEQECPDGACPADQLAAFLGRDVS